MLPRCRRVRFQAAIKQAVQVLAYLLMLLVLPVLLPATCVIGAVRPAHEAVTMHQLLALHQLWRQRQPLVPARNACPVPGLPLPGPASTSAPWRLR